MEIGMAPNQLELPYTNMCPRCDGKGCVYCFGKGTLSDAMIKLCRIYASDAEAIHAKLNLSSLYGNFAR